MRAYEIPPELAAGLAGLVRTAALAQEAAEDLAAATGRSPDSIAVNLQALIDARCWKRIPECFNGWATGLCARPGRHAGDCSPYPNPRRHE